MEDYKKTVCFGTKQQQKIAWLLLHQNNPTVYDYRYIVIHGVKSQFQFEAWNKLLQFDINVQKCFKKFPFCAT